jgi:DNA-binding LacI/PurR family transcriptional regulator
MEAGRNQGKTRAGFSARTTIGLLIDNVDEDFQRAIWAGVESAAKEAGVNVVNFLGGDLDPAAPAMVPRNAIFELITPASVQGLIIASAVMASYVGNERLDEHCLRYRPIPMVSLGFPLASMPSVLCDSQLGLVDLIEHLIQAHGRQRFMFLGGAPENPDSKERERLFHETLAAHGIPVDPRLICRASFRPDRAYALVRQAHDQGIPFDAVVAANDEMAIAAIDALDDVGIRIPEDVSITGFDDILSASRLSLPLTTVRQPTHELARRAVQLLLAVLKGEQPPPVERHSTQVVIRRSCGCFSETVRRAGEGRPKTRRGPGMAALTPSPNLLDVILAALRKEDVASLGPLGRECLETLVKAFVTDVAGTDAGGSFLARLDTSLRANFAQELGDDLWEDYLTILRRETGGRVSPAAEARAETLLHQARVLVKEAARQQQWKAHAQLTRQTQTLQYGIDYLVGAFDVPMLLDMMARELPRLGIRRCYLALHTPGRAWEEARLVLAYDQNGRKALPQEGIAFPAARLLPDGIVDRNDRVNLIWQPLVFEGSEELGFMGMDLNPRDEVSSLALAQQIRSALKASMMMEDARAKDRRIAELEAQVAGERGTSRAPASE